MSWMPLHIIGTFAADEMRDWAYQKKSETQTTSAGVGRTVPR